MTGKPNEDRIPIVFISSTVEDLQPYREAAQKAANKARFLPRMQEYFDVQGGNPPLNVCLEEVAGVDVVVVIVAHRLGWQPEDPKNPERKSITWLECEKAAEDGKEVLAFLVDKEVDWPAESLEETAIVVAMQEGKATAKLFKEVNARVSKLKEFKAWLDEQGIRATFRSPEDLRGKIGDALNAWRGRYRKLRISPAAAGERARADTAPVVPPAYREWLSGQCARIDLLGLNLKEGLAPRLRNVYVPLATPHHHESTVPDEASPSPDSIHAGRRTEEPRHRLLLDLLTEESLYLPGAPGSGKSTFCRWVSWLACEGSLPSHPVPPPEGYQEDPSFLRDRLPLLIPLRTLWEVLDAQPGRRELSAAELEAELAKWVERKTTGLDWDTVAAHLEAGTALVILDGVDELPLREGEDKAAWYPRAMLMSGLADAVPQWTKKGNRVLLTSRPYGVCDEDVVRLGIRPAPIAELDEELQRLLTRRWFRCLEEKEDTAEAAAREMLSHVGERPELGPLTGNPMLLTAICIIYHQGSRLPRDKYTLYDRIVENVLYNRYREDPGEIALARTRLSVIAYGMHTGHGTGTSRSTPAAEVSHDEIERMIEAFTEERRYKQRGYKSALETREQLLSRSGLLLPRGRDRADFYHLSIQEFLAACWFENRHRENPFEAFRDRAGVREWHNTLSFVFGAMLAKDRDPERGVHLLERMIETLEPGGDLSAALLVADCLLSLGPTIGLDPQHEQRLFEVATAAIEREAPIRDRVDLWLRIGRYGDPRIPGDVRDEAASVEIPAGQYVLGEDRRLLQIEKPFRLSRYPVTNRQFEHFWKDGGYENEEWWSEEGQNWLGEAQTKEPQFWRNSKWNGPNQPVVGVSYWEAEAFANWALGCLPTEHEWEVAARGPGGYEYPWGNDWENGICNSVESGLFETSPVGLFPRARSTPFELEDMAGNVWEWTSGRCPEKESFQSLCGGAWDGAAGICRCIVRSRARPGNRNYALGFRLML